jgi:sterol desaturase/sphingolipid hydroxylase (fatty acid hydroxylase superfamily)
LPPNVYLDIIVYLFGPTHIITIVIWMILRMYDGYNAHCGYKFSWSALQLLPFCTNDDFHDFHRSHNCGNYSAMFRFWDI